MSVKVKNKHSLKKKEIKKIVREIKNIFPIDFHEKNLKIEIGFFNDVEIIFIDDEPCFMIIDDKLFFTLKGVMKFEPNEKFVIVDMGAVSYITSGADLMAPGIVNADENIRIDDQVWICDEQYNRPLAIGIAIMSGDEMVKEKNGKSVKIIHYVGDKYWNLN